MSWNSNAEWWNSRMGENGDWFNNSIIKPCISSIVEMAPKTSSFEILDIGCGNGHLSRFLKSKGFYVTGIDTAPNMIKCALEYPNRNITYLNCDIFSKELEKHNFKYFVLNNVLQDVENIDEILDRVYELSSTLSEVIITIRHPCFHPKSSSLGWYVKTTNGFSYYTGQGLVTIHSLSKFW